MLFLSNFTVIRPPYEYSQEDALLWIAKAHKVSHACSSDNKQADDFHTDLLRKLLALGVGPNKIKKRGTAIPDFLHDDFANMAIYEINTAKKCGGDIKTRSDFFEKTADTLFERFYEQAPLADHLLQVTCTGYTYPSAAQKIASKKNALNTTITNVYHMGCYAAIPAIRIAGGLITQNEKADIVHTEMCSLHLNPELHDIEQLVVQTLFADGFIKYSVSKQKTPGFEVLATHEMLIPESTDCMSWKQESWGMKMHIAKTVPGLIKKHLKDYIQALFDKAKIPPQAAYYAIHPGGPKIIDEVAKELNLPDNIIRHSVGVLENYGNMSSATLPHIWEAILQDPSIEEGALVVSLAFGPGLTVAGSLMRLC